MASSLHLFVLFVVRVSGATPLAGTVALKNEEEAVTGRQRIEDFFTLLFS
jgi:hypothetical protein